MVLPLTTIWLYGGCFFAGLILQSLLPRNIRILVYPLSFVLGFIGANSQLYYLLAFNAGMISWPVIGKYWHCVAIETAALLLGIAAASLV